MDLMTPMSFAISKLSNSDIQPRRVTDIFELSIDFAKDIPSKAGNNLKIANQMIIDKESIKDQSNFTNGKKPIRSASPVVDDESDIDGLLITEYTKEALHNFRTAEIESRQGFSGKKVEELIKEPSYMGINDINDLIKNDVDESIDPTDNSKNDEGGMS